MGYPSKQAAKPAAPTSDGRSSISSQQLTWLDSEVGYPSKQAAKPTAGDGRGSIGGRSEQGYASIHAAKAKAKATAGGRGSIPSVGGKKKKPTRRRAAATKPR